MSEKNEVRNEKFDPQSMDAVVWAKEFMRIYENKKRAPQDHPDSKFPDEGDMLGWFANAIMAGYDEARRRYEGTGKEADMKDGLDSIISDFCSGEKYTNETFKEAIRHFYREKIESMLNKKHSTECNLWHDVGGVARNINREGFRWECNCGLDEHKQALTDVLKVIEGEE